MSTQRRTILILSQVFVPDPASVGQHVADVAYELVRRGYDVRVYAANRSYEDASIQYPGREDLNGVEVRRLPLSSFGKKSILTRLIGTVSFMVQVFFRSLFTPRLEGIFFSTSPPMVGVIATIVGIVRRVPLVYWAMDLNPDQLIALGKLKPTSFTARLLEGVNKWILKHAGLTIALDRFMADRLRKRGTMRGQMLVLPPWPHEQHLEPLAHDQNPFRKKHGLDGKFVVMYSGNHSPSNPLKTLLDAAVRLKDHPQIRFLFVGGGAGKKEVENYIREHGLTNAVSLPYQPLADLRYSLSSADVHVVSLGEGMIGIIHPCKVYGAMAVSRPVLFLGPKPSHVSDLLDQHSFGLHVSHGDVDGAERAVMQLFLTDASERDRMGREAARVLEASLSQEILCGKLCDGVETAFGHTPARAQRPTESSTPAPAA